MLPLVVMVVGRQGRLARRHLGHDPRRHDRRPAHGAGRARASRSSTGPTAIVNFAAADLGETPAILALLLYSSRRLEHLPRDRDRAARRRSCSASSSSSCSCAASSARPGSSSPSRRSASPRSWSRSGSCCRSGSATATSCSTRRSSTCTSRSVTASTARNFFGNDVLTLIVVPIVLRRARRCSSASPRSASRCAPRPRTRTARRCSASRCAGSRASCGASPGSSRSSRCSCASASTARSSARCSTPRSCSARSAPP